ncbi:hypothetical protein GXW82_20965 [Streptacidiphilus sp. 4-A2]|nr:hypothetical protein [Streptacidiphilus sp. 4-A2]
MVLAAALFASMVIGIQGYSIPYMLQTPTRAQLTHSVLAEVISGSGGRVTSAMAPILHIGFNTPLALGLGASLLGYGWHSAVFSGGTGMLSGGGGGEWSRKVGPGCR